MSTQEDPEPGTPVAEESKKCHRNLRGKEDPKCWRKVAIFFGSVALCLLIALATSLGIFLKAKSECEPPHRRDNSTTTYLGSASAGAQVTYVCQAPLLFPDNSPTFTVACTDDLHWMPGNVPSCGIYTSRICHFPDLGLNLTGRPSTTGLEIKIVLQDKLPPSLQVDIPTYDDSMCIYDELEQEPTTTASLTERTADVMVVVHTFQNVDPWAPYEVRLRSSGTKLAVTVLQGDTTATILTSLATNTTTPTATDTTDATKTNYCPTQNTTTSDATNSTGTQDTTDVTSTANTTILKTM